MRDELSEAQVESYQKNGFLLVESFLDREEMEEWRRCTEEAVAERLKSVGLHNQSNPDDYYAKVFTQCLRLVNTHEGMRRLLFDPRLGKMAATLAGVDGIRIWHDQALIKPAYGNPTAWHLDNPYWSFTSPNSISIWVALDDATLQNGCMYYIPGSQKGDRHENVGIGHNIGALFTAHPEWLKQEPVPAPCPAGSAVFHNGLTAHGAGCNMTPRPRRAMTCAYMPDGSTFNGVRNILSKEYFESLKIGDVLDNDTENPLIWRRA
ncbi:MAG TPA: phytanoyl-CoA dioxygenase family protein [Armatimonadota bacterium]|nr:phytanoyl-CoA dioxygenase family protein [Armatimonadota bacterium]